LPLVDMHGYEKIISIDFGSTMPVKRRRIPI